MRLRTALTIGVVAALGGAAVASAHIRIDPARPGAGSVTRLTLAVPSELRTSPTTKVSVQLPASIVSASFRAIPGWKRTVVVQKLVKPTTLHGESITQRIASVSWTATGSGIAPGDVENFEILVALPNRPGAKLAFPTVQTYANGKVMRWIGAADADEPAPIVALGPAVGA